MAAVQEPLPQEPTEPLNQPLNQPGYLDYRSLTRGQRQDVRAAQRTFDGAYIRTAFSEMTFGLVIIRLFSREFLPVGTVYTVHAMLMIILALVQRYRVDQIFLKHLDREFVTSGHVVLLSGLLAILADIALFVLILRLGRKSS